LKIKADKATGAITKEPIPINRERSGLDAITRYNRLILIRDKQYGEAATDLRIDKIMVDTYVGIDTLYISYWEWIINTTTIVDSQMDYVFEKRAEV
jgi:hypothetical protein